MTYLMRMGFQRERNKMITTLRQLQDELFEEVRREMIALMNESNEHLLTIYQQQQPPPLPLPAPAF